MNGQASNKIVEPVLAQMRLDRLPPRTCAIIRRIETDSEDIQRLKMLGVCVGRQIEIVKSGDPLIIKIFGSRIGLSASLAACVWLEVCETSRCAFLENSGA